MSELCQRCGVSRRTGYSRTGYKWLARFEQGGLDGLKDQSRRPHSSPRQTCPEVQQVLLRKYDRTTRPGDPRNCWPICNCVAPSRPDLPLPAAASTVGELLKQHGLTQPRKRPARTWRHALATRRRTALASRHSEPHSEPNRVRRLQSRLQRAVPHPRWQGLLWQGLLPANRERRARIAALFYAATRCALCPTGRCLPRVRARLSRVRLAHCHPHGHARTTACPFQPRRSVAFCGLSKLSVWWMVWWIKLGIAHQRESSRGSPSKTADTRE